MNTGNNSVFLPVRQEITGEKGTKAYLFSVVSLVNPQFPQSFWLSLFGRGPYDNNGTSNNRDL